MQSMFAAEFLCDDQDKLNSVRLLKSRSCKGPTLTCSPELSSVQGVERPRKDGRVLEMLPQ